MQTAPLITNAEFLVSWPNPSDKNILERGPLHLLWELIATYKVDILDVSLERITNDFLDFLANLKGASIEKSASFITMASRLTFYKSRALLPQSQFQNDYEETRLPPDLVQQLIEYREYQFAADKLQGLYKVANNRFSRTENNTKNEALLQLEKVQPEDSFTLNINQLVLAFGDVLRRIHNEKIAESRIDLESEAFSVENQEKKVLALLAKHSPLRFDSIFSSKNTKQYLNPALTLKEVVASFIAILEMVYRRRLALRQESSFASIYLFPCHKEALDIQK